MRGKPKLTSLPVPIIDSDGNPILVSKGEGGDAVVKSLNPGRKSVGGGGGAGGGDEDGDVRGAEEEEDVDSVDIGSDGTIYNDERGQVEVGLPAVSATLKVRADEAGQFPQPAQRPAEVSEADIPSSFSAPDVGDGAICRILDNFFICDLDGYASGCACLLQVFVTCHTFPSS